jgi:hypothetical protein
MNTKRLAFAASIILLTAISGQASARTAHPAEKYRTNATYSSSEVRHPEEAFGSAIRPQATEADVHRYSGGPKSND